ncbi:MAG: DUF4364 family protein [Ruminococcus sp.]|nr:DUF4364 family protein [Ruminococcus sp.]
MDHNFEKYVTPNMLNLTDKYAIKILLCYFLKQIDRPITQNQLTEIVTGDGIINYFLYMESLEELLQNGLLYLSEVDGVEYVRMSDAAEQTADEFKGIVPKSFRDKILAAGLRFFARLKSGHVKCEIEEAKKGASVHFICTDGGEELVNLKLYAPDITQAEYMKAKIMENPSEFYSNLLDLVIENKEE